MQEYMPMIVRLLLALLAGSVIGLERAFHGRPAGLRTHALVCTSSSLLMLFTSYQWDLLAGVPVETIRVDPTRMAQGIMTGIGFLGAGVIMKEKLTIRGLTTAASIWMTAAIGIIIGMGFFSAAFFATAISIIVLALFGWSERAMPTRHFGRLKIRFKFQEGLAKETLFEIMNGHNITASSPSYHLEDEGNMFEYQMTIFTVDTDNFHKLAEHLSTVEQIREFSIIPTGD